MQPYDCGNSSSTRASRCGKTRTCGRALRPWRALKSRRSFKGASRLAVKALGLVVLASSRFLLPAQAPPPQAPPATNAPPTPVATNDVSIVQSTNGNMTYVTAKGPEGQLWDSVTTLTNDSGQVTFKTNIIHELNQGKYYWNGIEWASSDPSFDETEEEFRADRVQARVRLKK